MKKVCMGAAMLGAFCVCLAAQVSFTNETTLQFKSNAEAEANTGVEYLRNQFDISGDFEKFSFNGRLRMQLEPLGSRTLGDGVTFISGFSKYSDAWIRANVFLRPVRGLEFAVGTNIDYALGTGSNWGDYEGNEFSRAEYVEYYGKNDWAKEGLAVKYTIAGFEVGAALPAYEAAAQKAVTKANFALKYTMDEVFYAGGAYFADFSAESAQTFAVSAGVLALKQAPLNIFADYATADKSGGLKNEVMNIGLNVPVYVDALTIEAEFCYRVLFGADYAAAEAKNPWFAGIFASYECRALTPSLWVSYASGDTKVNPEFRLDVKPALAWKTGAGTLGAAFNLILTKNPGTDIKDKVYVGWELPVSWTISW